LAAIRSGTSMQDFDAQLAGTGEDAATETDGVEGEDDPEELDERDPRAPQLAETRAFGRADSPVTGISDNGPIVRAAFELSAEDRIPEAVIEAGGEYFVVRLLAREVVEREDMEPDVAERMRNGLIGAKRNEVLQLYISQLRADAMAEGAILNNYEILSYADESSRSADAPE
jgi:hypothetical protein